MHQAAGNNLVSVILFGSAAAGDFHPQSSDVNLFCILRDSSFSALQSIATVVKWWVKQKQPPPLFMTRDEVERSADVFSIEFLDIQQNHRLVFGDDIIRDLKIPTSLHRMQVEYELREKLALLRQHLLIAVGDDKRMWELMTRSISSFATLFRHALMVMGRAAPPGKREAVEALAEVVGFDASGFLQVLDAKASGANRGTLDTTAVFSRYLAAVEQVTAAVDRMQDSGDKGSS